MAIGLVFIENHEQFPSVAEKVKNNFGFMFTAPGKAGYIMAYVRNKFRHREVTYHQLIVCFFCRIAFLAFSQGWIGTLLGLFFFVLALFNFFLIYRVRYHDRLLP